MVYKEHLIELWVNGKKVDLESQKSLNLRFQNVLFDPTKISSTQGEYSFEFDVPATPNNNIIFDHANNLSKLNKFHQRYNAEVYADGAVIFNGTITVNSYKDKKYSLNLVSVKVYSLDDIFGDMTMDKIKDFKIDFDGVESINEHNQSKNPDATFPLISYGVFQKSPKSEDTYGRQYTSKFDLDEYNRWYVESFPPSHNMMATLRKAFESVDYTVGGNAFNDSILKNIYMSVNLADGQTPEYNIGNPRFGSVNLTATVSTSGSPYIQELSFPYYKIYDIKESDVKYNFKNIALYDVLKEGSVSLSDPNTPSYMYQPDEHLIVIPADGFYKIELSASTTLNTTGSISATQYVKDMIDNTVSEDVLELTTSLKDNTPLEIHLVRNYDDNIELIKGKQNVRYDNGNPNDETYTINRRTYPNIIQWLTCFPHEDLYGAELPTEKNDLTIRNRGGLRGSSSSDSDSASDSSSPRGGRRARTRGGTIDITNGGERWYTPTTYGYMYNDNEIMCYDQAVSEAFICGLSSLSDGVTSVMKNGYSWSRSNATLNESFYPEIGYSMVSINESGSVVYKESEYNQNTYINTPISYNSVTNNTMKGYVSCLVKLNKGDILNLYAVQRGYYRNETLVKYTTTSNINLKISAYSPRSYNILKATHSNVYNLPTEFDVKLNLANWFNKEKKVSDWVQNIADAFNLDIIQNGTTVQINTKKKVINNIISAVDIDDRVNTDESEASKIEYPRSMAVKYKIDTDEWGFERSAVESKGGDESILNDEDWKKYGALGPSVVILNDDTYETSTSDKSLQFSYTWYDNFSWYAVNSDFEKTSTNAVLLRIPVISKYSYMIDGYDYEESMKHDGYGQAQRFWFKPSFPPSNAYVYTRTYPTQMVNLAVPQNYSSYDGSMIFNLSYKNTEPSILTNYFNINAFLASNYVEVEVYLSPDEYNRIKNGALVHFDSDLYIPVEISGYDPSGYNQTTLKLMKKVV